MELLLVVACNGRPPVDVRVETDPASPGAELLAALRDVVGTGPVEGWVARTGARIAPDRPVDAIGLVHGDRIELTALGRTPTGQAADPAAPPPVFELCVVGGPDAGRRYPLRAGRGYVVGRDASADITVDDERASRRHVHLGVGSKSVVATDAGSTNGTFLDGVALREPTALQEGQVLEVGSTQLSVEPVAPAGPVTDIVRADGREAFSRPPRVAAPTTPHEVRVPAPPLQPPKRKVPLSAAIVPVVMGGVLAIFLGPVMLLFALMGPVVLALSTWEDRRSGRKDYAGQRAAYDTMLGQLEDRVEQTFTALLTARRAAAPNMAQLAAWVRTRSPRLWERRPTDEDFLSVRIGTADLPSALVVDVALPPPEPGSAASGLTETETADQARARDLAQTHAVDPAVPVDVGLPVTGVLGIAGAGGRAQRAAPLARDPGRDAAQPARPGHRGPAALRRPRLGLAPVAAAHRDPAAGTARRPERGRRGRGRPGPVPGGRRPRHPAQDPRRAGGGESRPRTRSCSCWCRGRSPSRGPRCPG